MNSTSGRVSEWLRPGKGRYSVVFGDEGFLNFLGRYNFAMRKDWQPVNKKIILDLESEAIVKKLSNTGINLIWTDFSCGLGPTAERLMREEAKRFVELCHKYEIRVLLYAQFSNIFWVDFL